MRLIHLADLHLGKRLQEISMEEEQRYALQQVIDLIHRLKGTEKQIDGVIIAGDVYDKNIPTVTAVTMFDEFITKLTSLGVAIYMISGNHDSAERLGFGAKIFEHHHIHMASVYDGQVKRVEVQDKYGMLNIYLLPYIRPIDVKRGTGEEVTSYEEAMRLVLEREPFDWSKRNIIVAHQNIIGAQTSDSELVMIGGLDGIPADLFLTFDYVALGHLHKNQRMKSERIRYAGSLLKYSLSEKDYKKCITVLELQNKGDDLILEEYPLVPIHNMRSITGKFDDIMAGVYDDKQSLEDYIYVTLTDETEITNVSRKLYNRYPNLLGNCYDNTRTRNTHSVEEIEIRKEKSPMEYIEEFYTKTNGQEMSEEQRMIMDDVVRRIWEEQL